MARHTQQGEQSLLGSRVSEGEVEDSDELVVQLDSDHDDIPDIIRARRHGDGAENDNDGPNGPVLFPLQAPVPVPTLQQTMFLLYLLQVAFFGEGNTLFDRPSTFDDGVDDARWLHEFWTALASHERPRRRYSGTDADREDNDNSTDSESDSDDHHDDQ